MNIEFKKRAGRKATRLLAALANESRLAIMCVLLQGEHSVGELQHRIGLSQSALSQHLAKLRAENFVQTRRKGTTIFYSIKGEGPTRVLMALYDLYCQPAAGRRTRAFSQ